MLKKSARISNRPVALAGAVLALVVMFAARPVFAASGTVSQVEYNVSAHVLALEINQSNSTLFLAQTVPPGGCTNVPAMSVDEIKTILTIAQASYLSGRSISLGTAVCNGSTFITDIALQ
jgi:hypothetical protein